MKSLLVLGQTLALALPLLRGAEPPSASTDFVHFLNEDRLGSLEVAMATYGNGDGVLIDLIGAVHVGDTVYYQELNERFTSYDSVLYEMVGDPERLINLDAEDPGQVNAIRMLQNSMKRILNLDYQLDVIDYTATNFVHADLTLAEFVSRQEERGESIFTFIQNAMKAQLAAEANGNEAPQLGLVQLIQAFMSRDQASALKILVAEQLDYSEQILGAAEVARETVILTDRNKRVMEVLQERLAEGDDRLAIFFGAAHCPDLEKRILGAGFQRIGQNWLTAWRIPK